jgi:UDP-GlcNAc:undecaprenyl-phosphate GlcNAc-1-phosphate transferase
MIAVVVLLILLALALALPATWYVRRLGRRLGALDAQGSAGHVKSEVRRVPNTGGVAIFFAIATPVLVGLAVAWILDPAALPSSLEALAPHLPGVRARTPMALALLLSLSMLHVLGLIDDRRPLGPWLKLGVQILAAGVLIVGFDTRMLTLLDGWAPPLGYGLSVGVTLLWFLVVTNAINFMDNMDALAGGVVAIAGSIFLSAAMINEQWFLAMLLALIIGACLGFLIFNRPPATIFMGDGGSLVLGFLLAFLTVRTTYFGAIEAGEETRQALGAGYTALFMPLIILAVPLYDFVGVVALRLSQGRNPMTGDEQHFSHRLVRLGMSKRAAVFVIHACTIATGIGGIALARLEGYQATLVFLQTACILGVLATLELATARHKRRGQEP